MPNKSLGQHWLHDKTALEAVAEAAGLEAGDVVLEIGPGLGTLTAVMLPKVERVIAVELDSRLSKNLKLSFTGSLLEVVEDDILNFNFNQLPPGYKVAANLPYYITAPTLQKLAYDRNPPVQMGLLVQKEVAQRLSAGPGDLSILAVTVQNRYDVTAGLVVPAKLFKPVPKVDSQVISLRIRPKAVFGTEEVNIIKLVKAGFSNRRKTLVNSLSAARRGSKETAAAQLKTIGAGEQVRAQELSLPQWRRLYELLGD